MSKFDSFIKWIIPEILGTYDVIHQLQTILGDLNMTRKNGNSGNFCGVETQLFKNEVLVMICQWIMQMELKLSPNMLHMLLLGH